MRLLSLFVLVLAACEPPRRPPTIVPMGANEPCPSSTDSIGRVRYTCSSYQVVDSIAEPVSLRAVGQQLAAEAHATDGELQATMRPIAIEGATEAIVVEYSRDKKVSIEYGRLRVREFGRTFDLVAAAPADGKLRLLQCIAESSWEKRAVIARQAACTNTIERVLRLPPPKDTMTAECHRALRHVSTLPEQPTDPGAVRDQLRAFAVRCTDPIARCALAATTYVEATVCY